MTVTPAAPAAADRGRLHARAARPARPRAAVRRGRADPERGAGRARRRAHPGRAQAAHQARGGRRAAVGRAARGGARRAGLVEGRVVPRRGAARPLDERAVAGTCRARTTCSASGSPEQIERYLKPALRGELHDAYAVTEAEAGLRPVADRDHGAPKSDGGWVIDGEKWFVTYGDVAAVYIVMANAMVDGERLPTLFLVDRSARRHRDRGRPAVQPHLSARPSDDPLQRGRGRATTR